MTPTTLPDETQPAAKAVLPFTCSICGDGSEKICVWCTKDCCELHRCEKCGRCSDCCLCDLRDNR